MSKLAYFDISIPAPVRLAMMRRDFEQHAAKYPNCPDHAKPKTWRDVRGWTHKSYQAAFCAGLSAGFNGEGLGRVSVWYSHTGPHFRDETPVHDRDAWAVSSREHHKGWYTEHDGTTSRDGSGLAWGIVARLPHSRFIAGYQWGDNDERVYFSEIFSDEGKACRAADSHAESFAEMCKEDSYKNEQARELSESIEEAFTRLRECLALRNKACFARLRDEARELMATIREKRHELKTEFSGYF